MGVGKVFSSGAGGKVGTVHLYKSALDRYQAAKPMSSSKHFWFLMVSDSIGTDSMQFAKNHRIASGSDSCHGLMRLVFDVAVAAGVVEITEGCALSGVSAATGLKNAARRGTTKNIKR